jgi:amidophosphoribosyltransferase
MCGVGGVLLSNRESDPASAYLYETMYALQHRGDEASGMASMHPGEPLHVHREKGMVKDVYDESSMQKLVGETAVAWVRYSTSGKKNADSEGLPHPQPVTDEGTAVAHVHNGNFPDMSRMETHLASHNLRTQNMNDSEKAALCVTQEMRTGADLPTAIERAQEYMTGAYSCIAMHDDMMVAYRDPYGIRPLAIGRFEDNWVVSSETCGLDIINAKYQREVLPGELAIFTPDGRMESRQLADGTEKLDMFEFVYFARHDSYLYGQSVNEVRRRLGEGLAELHGPLHDDPSNTVVVPIPDTSIPIAEGYAHALKLTMKQAVIKNRFIGRTFMQPSDHARKTQLRRKHNMIKESIRGKDIIFIDDSIVRLNTIPNLVSRAWAIGAKSVSVLIGSPPVRFPDYYGIDTPDQRELAAANMTVEQMQKKVGCNYLGFLTLDRMLQATQQPAEKFNLSCFTGEYPIDIGPHKKKLFVPRSMQYVE